MEVMSKYKGVYMKITNVAALFANRQVDLNANALENSMRNLSSGSRINRSADDSAGLAVSEKLRAQIRGLNQAGKNIQSGISFIQATEGYLQETTDILQRLRELAVQSSNGIYSDEDRMYIQVEVSQLISEVDRIASHAQFNGFNILTGRFAQSNQNAMSFQVGSNMDQNIQMHIESATAEALGLKNEQGIEGVLGMADSESANRALGTIDNALKQINSQRANLGAMQNRTEHAARGIAIASENMTAANSVIRDANMAETVVEYTKQMILQQSSMAMLANANQNGEMLLNLLK